MLLAGGRPWKVSTTKGRDPEEGSKAAEVKRCQCKTARIQSSEKRTCRRNGQEQPTSVEPTALPVLRKQRQACRFRGSSQQALTTNTRERHPAPEDWLDRSSLPARRLLPAHHCQSTGSARTQPAFPGRKRRRGHRLKEKKCPDSEFEL